MSMADSSGLSSFLMNDVFQQSSPLGSGASSQRAHPSPLPTPAPSSPGWFTDEVVSIGSRAASVDLDTCRQLDDRPPENAGLRAKRNKRLHNFLESLRHAPVPSLDAHNAVVDELCALAMAIGPHAPSPGGLAAALERLGGESGGTRGFIFGLLGWEVFRREEERLARTERLSTIAASKAANKYMVETLHRRAKTRDWARDGRKAAKIVFDALLRRTPAERGFALLLLARTMSLDGMLKVAHFPVTRAAFSASFAQIVESKAELWQGLAVRGYRTFDFEALLRQG